MSAINLQLLVSTISSFLLNPCLQSDDSPSRRSRSRKKKLIVCNQYQHRLYLRPIMPATTRRQSDITSIGASLVPQPPHDVEPETWERNKSTRLEEDEEGVKEQSSHEIAENKAQDVQLSVSNETKDERPFCLPASKQRTQSTQIANTVHGLNNSEKNGENNPDPLGEVDEVFLHLEDDYQLRGPQAALNQIIRAKKAAIYRVQKLMIRNLT
ncbi:hypothetical protein BKA66DRAFT_576320 [Pyrenochaeta sp. MPI-SDFR-AT-0127]|nr:hypothetical protein BKA66DRAFT_576320 [Pyrenochaeta sp. MPI-SDFR-AT-0127]